MIEFLIVLTSATIMLSSVDSWLGSFEVRSKVSDALQVAESARKDILITCTADSTLAELSNEIVAYEFNHSEFVRTLTISGSCESPQITLETQNTGLILDPTIVITGGRSGAIYAWTCQSNGADSATPKRCRES
ncbi:MAG TPA: pilin [Xanthomonadales bacterium]|nr:pilin [Xanthomonadales bacterium]